MRATLAILLLAHSSALLLAPLRCVSPPRMAIPDEVAEAMADAEEAAAARAAAAPRKAAAAAATRDARDLADEYDAAPARHDVTRFDDLPDAGSDFSDSDDDVGAKGGR